MWQVDPTVVVGRNQSVESEVNTAYCRQHGVDVCRRKSGGGAIYADMGNVMFSVVSPGDDVAGAFARYLGRVVPALRALGVPAKASGRNDVMVDGHKVSGTAFYRHAAHSIVHGTMLFDTDMANMAGCLTPSTDKLHTKGVASVPARIGLLKDYLSMDIESFKHHVRNHLCDHCVQLTPADDGNIHEIERTYRAPSFLQGANPACDFVHALRVEHCGTVEARVRTFHGRIRAVDFTGDFFALTGLAPLQAALAGTVLNEAAIRQAIADTPPERFIRHFQADDLITLLLNRS